MENEKNIESFAFFDLETCALPEYNFGKTSITEFSVQACSSSSLLESSSNGESPRVLHKLTLCFNPQMMIHPTAEDISGLNNELLEFESTFDKNAGNIILNFLNHLRKPICLVAHNGKKFDFPILKKRFKKLGLNFPDEVLFLDSLDTFREIDDVKEQTCASNPDSPDNISNSNVEIDEKELKSIATEDVCKEQTSLNNIKEEITPQVLLAQIEEESIVNRQEINETTPKRTFEQKFRTAKNRNKTDSSDEPRTFKSRKRLFASNMPEEQSAKKKSYKLESIYSRCFGKNPDTAHHADADVSSLLKIATFYGKDFIEHAQRNAMSSISDKVS